MWNFNAALVRKTMKEMGISQAALARALGLPSQSAVSALLSGNRRVAVEEAGAIYAFLGIAPGTDASATPEPTGMQPSARLRESVVDTDALPGVADYAVVPVIGVAGAGRWREAVETPQGHMPVPSRLAARGTFAIAVSGDSMDLVIEDGGLILVDPGQKELAPGGVYLIANSAGDATVKRYRRDPARFEPCSTNPAYRPFLVSDDDFSVLGKIVWKSSPVI